MTKIYEHLAKCKYCHRMALFDVSMRHGAEYPACSEHIAAALAAAYSHDGDYGQVTVYLIGVASETQKRGG